VTHHPSIHDFKEIRNQKASVLHIANASPTIHAIDPAKRPFHAAQFRTSSAPMSGHPTSLVGAKTRTPQPKPPYWYFQMPSEEDVYSRGQPVAKDKLQAGKVISPKKVNE
jgi:hypothetical protein